MRREIVHEEGDLLVRVGRPQTCYVFLELLHIHRLLEDLEVLHTLLLRDATEKGEGGLVEHLLVYGHVLSG